MGYQECRVLPHFRYTMPILGRKGGSAMDTGKVAMQVRQCWDSDTITNGYNENHQQSSADFTELRDGKHTDTINCSPHGPRRQCNVDSLGIWCGNT